MNLHVSKPCGNCPFRKVGAIDLRPGRVAGIVGDEDGNESVLSGPNSSVCAGSMACLLKVGAPSVAMRMGAAMGMIRYNDIEAFGNEIIGPEDLGSPAVEEHIDNGEWA